MPSIQDHSSHSSSISSGSSVGSQDTTTVHIKIESEPTSPKVDPKKFESAPPKGVEQVIESDLKESGSLVESKKPTEVKKQHLLMQESSSLRKVGSLLKGSSPPKETLSDSYLKEIIRGQLTESIKTWDSSRKNPREYSTQKAALEYKMLELSQLILETPGGKEALMGKSETDLQNMALDVLHQLKPKIASKSYSDMSANKKEFIDIMVGAMSEKVEDQRHQDTLLLLKSRSGDLARVLAALESGPKSSGDYESLARTHFSDLTEGLPESQVQKHYDTYLKTASEGLAEGFSKGQKLSSLRPDLSKTDRVDKALLLNELMQVQSDISHQQIEESVDRVDQEINKDQMERIRRQLQEENERLHTMTIEQLMGSSSSVGSTEISDSELAVFLSTKLTTGKASYESKEFEALLYKAIYEVQQPENDKLLWSMMLSPRSEMMGRLEKALFSTEQLLDPSMDGVRNQVTSRIYQGLLTGAMKKLSESSNQVSLDKTSITVGGESYKISKKLGEGTFGTAFLCTNPKTGKEVVIKQFKRGRMDEQKWFETMQQEIRAHHYAMGPDGLGHEHVLGLKGVIFQPSKTSMSGEFFTITESAGGGELTDVSQKINLSMVKGLISPEVQQLVKRALLAQVIEGMKYIQQDRQMLHLDIKPDNIFLTKEGTVKVADFGLSSISPTMSKSGGSPRYMSPEISHNMTERDKKVINPGTDVWSLGVMVREMLTTEKAIPELKEFRREFGPLEHNKEFGRDEDRRVYETGVKETRVSSEGKFEEREVRSLGAYEKLINSMMHPDPDQRPSLEAVSQTGFFSDPVLFAPEMQKLVEAIIAGDSEKIKEYGQQVARLDR